MRPRVEDYVGYSQELGSPHFFHKGVHGFFIESRVRRGKVDQIAVVSDDWNCAADSLGPAKGGSVLLRQRFPLPPIAVLKEYLDGPATDAGAALKAR